MKLKALFLAFLVLSGCGQNESNYPENISEGYRNQSSVTFNKTTTTGLREYCVNGVMYYGWLTASNGDWLAPVYDPNTKLVVTCEAASFNQSPFIRN